MNTIEQKEGEFMEKAKILVVEDEAIIASDMKTTLEEFNYEVVAVTSTGEEAIQLSGLYRPDLVLMDTILDGDIGGIEAAERIKSRFGIPTVYISSSADKKTLELAKLTEPLGFIIKPFDEKTLQSTVDIALYKSKTDKILSKSQSSNVVNRRVQRSAHSNVYKSSQAGLQQGWTRATFIVQTELLEKIKALAYWERRSIKEVIDEALECYLKGKEVVPIEK